MAPSSLSTTSWSSIPPIVPRSLALSSTTTVTGFRGIASRGTGPGPGAVAAHAPGLANGAGSATSLAYHRVLIPVLRHDWHVLKRLRTPSARVMSMIRSHARLRVVAVLALAALAVYFFTLAFGGLPLGDVPAWVTGAGTVGALFLAFYQIGQERNRRIAQEAEDCQDQRLAQARPVAAREGFTRQHEVAGLGSTGILLVIGSSEPVYSVFACAVSYRDRSAHH
jgi:hypothetical protein